MDIPIILILADISMTVIVWYELWISIHGSMDDFMFICHLIPCSLGIIGASHDIRGFSIRLQAFASRGMAFSR